MKKIISIILACILAFSAAGAACTAFAQEITEPVSMESIEPTDNVDAIDDTTEPEEEPEVIDVTMYICATAKSLTGHVWLYFVNNSNVPVFVGHVEIQPGQEMSVGSLRNSRKSGGGTYYNGEAMMAARDGKLDSLCSSTTSLKMSLDKDQLEKVSNKIKSMNYYEMIFCNCGVFATQVWNSVSDKKVVHIVLPMFTILNMDILGAEKGVVRMKDPEEVGAYKQKRDTVEKADPKSFRITCVNF